MELRLDASEVVAAQSEDAVSEYGSDDSFGDADDMSACDGCVPGACDPGKRLRTRGHPLYSPQSYDPESPAYAPESPIYLGKRPLEVEETSRVKRGRMILDLWN